MAGFKWSALLDDFRTFYASGLADAGPLSAPQQRLVTDPPKPDELPVGIEREDASAQPVAPDEEQTNVHSGPLPAFLSPRRRRGKSIQAANCSRSQHLVGIDQSDSAAASELMTVRIREVCSSDKMPIINGVLPIEGEGKRTDFAQPEDAVDQKTIGAAPDTRVAAAHLPEPELALSQSLKDAASEPLELSHSAETSQAPKPRTIPAVEEFPQVSPLLVSRYDREKLYEKVWTVTMQKAAREYGLSDVALGKICRKLYIPVPGRGYWNKKAANQPVEPRPSLPVIRIRSQQRKESTHRAIAKTASIEVPQPAQVELQHVEGTRCNTQIAIAVHRSGTNQAPKPRTPPVVEKSQQVSPFLMARYDREKLYDKVWTMPVRLAAREYGVSDVAIAKTCRKLNIPVPGRGYWAKKAANRPVKPRPPLPQPQID
jgi:hypothetical protein